MKPHLEHDDDKPVGRVLSRREVLALLGTTSAALLFGRGFLQTGLAQGAATPAATGAATAAATGDAAALPLCVVHPEQTEGPYFVDEKLNRSDIRPDPSDGSVREGVPLRLVFRVAQITTAACVPLPNAMVDVWHCDALGVYSDVQGGRGGAGNTNGSKFLRGYQMTDANGKAEFQTIYPGWYQGRTVHIHFKIRTDPNAARGQDFTSQLYFDDTLTDEVFKQAPYSSRRARSTRNNNDGVYRDGGNQLLLDLTKDDEGYVATFDIGLQMS
jgi:protocatechuate 3,4-dioxygenase beta subunit